ncbi:MAG TPA: HAMP domain-containing sensor histidine kinase [Candidatus Baltobacteraceae bacterium]|nr:HAMP domain-containing sensor histidine kinase [Candidatus Baltobacteraceae bacterium]
MTRLSTRVLLSSDRLLHRLAPALDSGQTVLLLVVRLPEFAQAAWVRGKRSAQALERSTCRAFRETAHRVVRDEDILIHDTGSDWFAVAMLAPARDGDTRSTLDARAALQRIAAGITCASGRDIETGWWPLANRHELEHLPRTIACALERGARERERLEYLATIGHELRTPLTSIRGYLETLIDGGIDADTSQRFLNTARAEALRLTRIVEGMLDFSLLDLSPATVLRGTSDICETLGAAIDALVPMASERHIAMHSNASGALYARIDADACMHAVINLLENALKYGRSGGNVHVGAQRVDPFIQITIDDDGSGIPVEEREAIFGLRTRGAAAARGTGRGIGLAIVRTIAERVGGWVDVDSSPLGGARFALHIPQSGDRAEAESGALLS